MADGTVFKFGEFDLSRKMYEELDYVLYLLKVNHQRVFKATLVIKEYMKKAKVLTGMKEIKGYVPKYKDWNGNWVEMKRNSAKINTRLNSKFLDFNPESEKAYFINLEKPLRDNSIYALRAAIYQTGESDSELKELRRLMMEELENKERRLLINYCRQTSDIEPISQSL